MDKLIDEGKPAADKGAVSMKWLRNHSLSGSEIDLLPLWILTYWKIVFELHKSTREPWMLAEASLENLAQRAGRDRDLLETRNIVQDVRKAIGNLRWTENLAGFSATD